MFIKKEASFEIEAAMEKALVSNAVEQETAGLTKVAEAMDLLNRAAEIFDEVGLEKQAEFTTALLESFAGRKAKKKVEKSKKPTKTVSKSKKAKIKSTDKAIKGLTSDKMVDNLKEKGWVFNVDDIDYADDFNDAKLFFSRMDNPIGSADYFRAQARKAMNDGDYDKAQEFLAKAKKEEELSHYDDELEIDDSFVEDNVNWEKDEHEQNLARIMHEIEEEEENRRRDEEQIDPTCAGCNIPGGRYKHTCR